MLSAREIVKEKCRERVGVTGKPIPFQGECIETAVP